MKHLATICVVLILALAGCEGDQGPIGPEGPQGEIGPEGSDGAGTRVVITGEHAIPRDPNPFCVDVPEIDLGDMPLVGVYISLNKTSWMELPTYFHPLGNYSISAEIKHRQVCFSNCYPYYYRIVIVK